MQLKQLLLIICTFLGFFKIELLNAQAYLTRHPISTESEIGQTPCDDTLKILKRKEPYDIGVILPSWRPVVDENYVAVLEGKIGYDRESGIHGPHVSHEDLPFYHFTHDLGFDVIPDPTDDNRFTNYLPYLVYERSGGVKDTALRRVIHVEWESGLGAGNLINPYRKTSNSGKSCGFASAGHERGDIIWNWPSIGDWVHVEGHLVWDRGHPPANVEIHPAQLLAIRRNLPEKLAFLDNSYVYATRVDVFANGDGGALRNNRQDSPDFVQKVKMSKKDYTIPITVFLPKPSQEAQLKVSVLARKGNTFKPAEKIIFNNDTAIIYIPWRSADGHDVDIFAKSFFFYWDEGVGVDTSVYPIDEYDVYLQSLFFKKQNDFLGITENRVFANIGSNWIFINDFLGGKKRILTNGIGHSAKRKWKLSNSFKIYVPRDKHFRVFSDGWDADGVDYFMGDIFNPYSPCTRRVKATLKAKLFSFDHMILSGCMDDHLGEVSLLHSFQSLSEKNYFLNYAKTGINEDPCPFSKFPLEKRYYLGYTIERK